MERKKLFKMFAVLAFVMLGMMLASCGGSDDDESGVSLAGKTYAAYAYKSDVDGSDVYWVFKFTSDKEFEFTTRYGNSKGKIISTETGTYTLNYPTLTCITEVGIIVGQKRVFSFVDANTFRYGNSMEFIKQ